MTDTTTTARETAIEPEMPIIDAHHHLIDRPGRRYLFDEYLADVSAGHNIRATVYIESQAMCRADGPEALRPVGETEFVVGIAAMSESGNYGPCRVNAGIVGHADLALGDAVAETLDAHIVAGGGRFRGIRQVALSHPSPEPFRYVLNPPPKDLLHSDRFREGFAQLGPRGLSFEATVFHTQLSDIAALADAFPETVIVLDHLGFAIAMGLSQSERQTVFEDWSQALREIARRPNVMAKIGGFGLPFWGFGFDQDEIKPDSDTLLRAWSPYIETGIDAFGLDRCMLESNFPVDAMSCDYVTLWNALKKATRALGAEDRHKLFFENAARIYRLDVAG